MLKRTAAIDGIAVLVTIHTPSKDSLLNHFTKFVTLEDGKLICNDRISNIWGGENEHFSELADDEVHDLLDGNPKSRLREFNNDDIVLTDIDRDKTDHSSGLKESMTPLLQASRDVNDETKAEDRNHIRGRKSLNTSSLFRQCVAIIQRLHSQLGITLNDIIGLPAVMVLLSLIFQFDRDSLTQVLFVVTCFIAVPVNVMRYLIERHCRFWCIHRSEILDRRISLYAFIIGSLAYQFALPTLMMFISLMLSYIVLGWKFSTLVVQFLFSMIYLSLSCQIGRAVGTYYDGNYGRFTKTYSLMITVTFLFGGTLVKVNKLPLWTPWMVSHNFWATSGAMMEHLYRGSEGIGQHPCTSFISCIYSDPNIIATSRGYSPVTTTYRSFAILVGCQCLFVIAEFVVTHRRLTMFSHLKTTIPAVQSTNETLLPKKTKDVVISEKDIANGLYENEEKIAAS